jgi:hypothetical protein
LSLRIPLEDLKWWSDDQTSVLPGETALQRGIGSASLTRPIDAASKDETLPVTETGGCREPETAGGCPVS